MVQFNMSRGLQVQAFKSANNLAHGKNSLMALRTINSSRVAVIYSPTALKDEKKKKKVIGNIRSHDLVLIEKDWPENFKVDDLRPVVREIEKSRADTIIAIGGGAVIDGAKMCWLLYENPQIDTTTNKHLKNPRLRGKSSFIAIPTTVGSGSEVSSSAVIFDCATGTKRPIVTHEFLPDLAILDPMLVTNLPKALLVSSACDALAHAIEGYVSTIKNDLMAGFAIEAVRKILTVTENLQTELSLEQGEELLLAATMAGWVQNHCLTGASHAIAHQLSAYGVPHGVGNAILLPRVISLNSRSQDVKINYEKLAVCAGLDGGVEGLIASLTFLLSNGNFSTQLKDFSPSISGPNIVGLVSEDPSSRTNPVDIDLEYIEEALEE